RDCRESLQRDQDDEGEEEGLDEEIARRPGLREDLALPDGVDHDRDREPTQHAEPGEDETERSDQVDEGASAPTQPLVDDIDADMSVPAHCIGDADHADRSVQLLPDIVARVVAEMREFAQRYLEEERRDKEGY